MPVPFDEALEQWAAAAREILIETARSYGSFLTQAELASTVQTETGIRAGVPVRHWIDELLAAVTRSRGEGEPLLAALCVRLDQSVGDAYPKVLEVAGLPAVADPDLDAARQRFACYQFFGAVLPAGARPTLTPRVAEKRAARKPARPARTARPKTAAPGKSAASAEAKPAAAKPKTAKPKVTKPKAAPAEEAKPKLCPTCFTVLPANGVCGYCA